MNPNPNKALWREKGDFTRIANSMQQSSQGPGRGASASLGVLKVLDLGCGDGTTALPEARLGADVLGVDIAKSAVGAGNARAQAGRRTVNSRRATGNLHELPNGGFDLVVSIFGAMFAPKPFDVAKEMTRVTRPGGRIVMGNWIPNDPTLSHADLEITPRIPRRRPGGFVSPMTWSIEASVVPSCTSRGGRSKGQDSFVRDTYTFNFEVARPQQEFVEAFRRYCSPR